MTLDIIPLLRGEDFTDEEECERCEAIFDILFDCDDEVLCLKCAVEAHRREITDSIVKAYLKQDTGEMTLVVLKAHIDKNTMNN